MPHGDLLIVWEVDLDVGGQESVHLHLAGVLGSELLGGDGVLLLLVDLCHNIGER